MPETTTTGYYYSNKRYPFERKQTIEDNAHTVYYNNKRTRPFNFLALEKRKNEKKKKKKNALVLNKELL